MDTDLSPASKQRPTLLFFFLLQHPLSSLEAESVPHFKKLLKACLTDWHSYHYYSNVLIFLYILFCLF